MKIDIDLDASKEELEKSEPGRIAYQLIRLEGRATWIPKFINWLFAEYTLERSKQEKS